MSKKLNGKYSQKPLDHAKESTIDVLETLETPLKGKNRREVKKMYFQ